MVEGSRTVGRRSRGRTWGRRLIVTAVAAALLVGAGGGLALLVTPSVADAPARVAALLAAHHGTPDSGVVPTRVEQALIATEDSRFYSHHGLDALGVGRALLGLSRGGDQGGATLDQQLAKLVWTPADSGLTDKVTAAALAVKLDARFTKAQILGLYLDAAYFGDGAYGLRTAAEHYFGLPADRLSWAQASLLAGLVQAPSAYDPHGHLSSARARQRHVLDRLVAVGRLTEAQAAATAAAPLHPRVTFTG